MFVSDGGPKAGFIYIVFQWLVQADEGSLLLTCHLQWLWITGCEMAERVMSGRGESETYGKRESACVEKTSRKCQ